MSEYLERICGGESGTLVLPRLTKTTMAPRACGVVAPRNIMMEDQSVFMSDALMVEYGDVLTMEEKADLSARRANGEPVHEIEASNAIDAYHATGDVAQLDRGIALLLHLRQTKHPD